MAQRLITIFGGSGFVGKTLVERLAKTGARIRVAVRHPNSALALKPLGDVGQIQVVQANLRNEDSVRAALTGADAVVNLVGILSQSGAQKFDKLHVGGAALVAKLSAEMGVKNLVHMSALGADEDAEANYARTKGEGEAAVRHYFPKATILRPSVIFGPDDKLFNRFAQAASLLPVIPVFSGDCLFQPVYVGDVVQVMLKALEGDEMQGQAYELGGVKTYSLRQLMALAADEAQQKVTFIDVPDFVAPFQVFFLGLLPNAPITLDQLKMLKKDNVVSEGAKSLSDLGITATPVEAILPSYLHKYRPKGQFAQEV